MTSEDRCSERRLRRVATAGAVAVPRLARRSLWTLLCLAAGCGSALRPVARKEDVRSDEILLVGRIRATGGGREIVHVSFRTGSGPFRNTGPMGLVSRAGRRRDLPIRLEAIRAAPWAEERNTMTPPNVGVWIVELGTRHSADIVLAPMAAGRLPGGTTPCTLVRSC